LPLALAVAGGCATVAQVTSSVGQAAGVIDSQQGDSLVRGAEAVGKTFQDITPEQEYYIGRSVAATVLAQYPASDRPGANRYLNLVGQTLALFSERPETYAGYHFLLMDSEEINAFAAPGGLILVSRGLVRCCRNEDMLAAVLAHEIGHAEKQHGLRAIKKGRVNSALTILAVEAGKNVAGDTVGQLTEAFEGSITDISTTLMNSGYSRALEREADAAAVRIMTRAGYNPAALVEMLTLMQQRLQGDSRGFGKTHPSPADRIHEVTGQLGEAPATPPPAARQQRFNAALGRI
jgi:predicted Zn-dependent protease